MERVAAEAIEMVVAAEELGAVAALSIKNHEVVGASNTGGGVRRADALRLEQEELKPSACATCPSLFGSTAYWAGRQ
jgi:hypothetical protein